jgi:hypothetical protein
VVDSFAACHHAKLLCVSRPVTHRKGGSNRRLSLSRSRELISGDFLTGGVWPLRASDLRAMRGQ